MTTTAPVAHPAAVGQRAEQRLDLGVADVIGRVGEHQVHRPRARRPPAPLPPGPRRTVAPRTPSVAMFLAMTAAARWSDSTNTADAAPRDSASRPSAPEPAYRSSTDEPVEIERAPPAR